jgi:hypothetical protein
MGYAGKVTEQRQAREFRAQAWTLQDIATELGVSKSSVSLWVRDVEFVPRPRNRGYSSMKPHPLHVAELAELERCRREGLGRIGQLSEREFLVLGLALYAGEGSKSRGEVRFANSDSRMLVVFLAWLRRFFDIDESRLRMRLYLHNDLDLDAGRSSPVSLGASSPSHTARSPMPRSDATGTSTAARVWGTAAPRRIAV